MPNGIGESKEKMEGIEEFGYLLCYPTIGFIGIGPQFKGSRRKGNIL